MEPAGRLDPQPWMTAPATCAVVAALGAEGSEARFVGGCVRDAILGRPVHDIDIATPVEPEGVIDLLERAGIKAVPTGIAHGTITAVTGGEHFEITTLREDVETFGRHARVAYTDDWMADAARRDLTMNAIFLAPDGTLYDPFGGLADLRAGRVRFVGDAGTRIEEDVLRLLRFFRFHAHYGKGEPDTEGLAACRSHAKLLPSLSAERVWAETRRLLVAPDPAATFALMAEAGVLAHFLPEAKDMARLAAIVRLEAGGIAPEPVRHLAALLPDEPPVAEAVAERLKFSRAERERLTGIAGELPGFAPAEGAAARRAIYRLGVPLFRDLVLLHWAGASALGGAGADGTIHRAALAEAAAWTDRTLPVHGSDALALGVPHGPAVGEALRHVEDWWIAGDFAADRAQALAKLKEFASARPTGR
jgi:poly(A) polymerase